MGDNIPVDPAKWNSEHAFESLTRLFAKYGVEGGTLWRWASYQNAEDSDLTLSDPVKRRGVDFVYNPVQKILVDVGGWHVSGLMNGSFESGTDHWTAGGSGSVTQYDLTQETGEPEVPWRGTHALRLVTGPGASDVVTATSEWVAVLPAIVYTTTANLRFSWINDPNPSGPGASRPNVSLSIRYLKANGAESAIRAQDSLVFHQEDSAIGFGAFPLQYAPPSDAAYVEVQFGAARNGLPTPLTLDVDDVR